MLKIDKLQSGYNGIKILHNIDFNIKTSEIVSIIGPNGAGKSTLLKSIFNLVNIYSGKIIFKNENIINLPTYQLIRKGISFVPQGKKVFSSLTVMENLEMGAFIFKKKDKQININIKDIFNKFSFLKDKQNQLANNLSVGQQQMLALARALIQNPKLLLLDEPFLGLSPKMTKEVIKKIEEINKTGVTIIAVSQNVKQIISISDRTYVLRDGRVVLEGNKDILKNNNKLKNIYF